jgi:serine/threonine protein kinase
MSQQQDDDGTVIRPASAPSADSATVVSTGPPGEASSSRGSEDGISLRIGARVGEFEITRRIGEGGFSIVYLAMDHSLERTVALKEYMPMSLATRVGTTQVQPRSERYRDTFEAGMRSFVNEAKLLAQFDHPSLVKVYRFWEANGTAYMVMPFYQGVTLKDAVRAMPGPPDEAWLMTLLGPLTQALAVIHAERCFHRDIAPDNVILLADGARPLLLDFGAARRVIGDMTQALTVILKAGYAPVEQYAEIPGMKQGPWTDVYALAAVVYWAVTGRTPPASVGRMLGDTYIPLTTCAAGRYSPRFLQAIDRALAVLPEQRTPSIEALRQDLGLGGGSSSGVVPLPVEDPDVTVIRPVRDRAAPANTVQRESPRLPEPRTEGGPPARTTQDPPAGVGDVEPAARPRRIVLVVSAAVIAAVALGAVWWTMQRPGPASSASTREAAASIAPTTQPSATPPLVDSPTIGSKPEAASLPSAASATPSPSDSRATAATPAQTDPPAPSDTAARSNPLATSGSAGETTPPGATDGAKPTHAPTVTPTEAAPKPPAPRAAKKTAPPADAATAESASDRAECARIFQRLSLGESNPELLARLKTLKCR